MFLKIDKANIIRVKGAKIQKSLLSRVFLLQIRMKKDPESTSESVADRSALSLIDFGRGNEHVMHPKFGHGRTDRMCKVVPRY